MARRVAALAVLVAGVGLQACVPRLYTPDDTDPADVWAMPDNTWPKATPPEGLEGQGFYEDQVVPDFRFADQHGDVVSLWQFYGQVIVLDVCTMWCAPCRELAEGTEGLYTAYEDEGFVYVTVLAEDVSGAPPDEADLDDWAAAFGITAPVLSDPDKAYTEAAVPDAAYPLPLVIDREMIVRARLATPSEELLAAEIEPLL